MKTTLNKIRALKPCSDGWHRLLTYLKKTEADDEPLSIVTILDSNGIDDALWCLRAVDGHDREIRLFAVWCARQVQHLITDPRSLAALDVAERYANGEVTAAELAAARVVSWDVARAVAWAVLGDVAWDVAEAAAEAAARVVAWDAVKAVARAASGDVAWDVAWAVSGDVAWDVAWDVARVAQSARLREVCAEIESREKK